MTRGSIARWLLFGASIAGCALFWLNFVASAWIADGAPVPPDVKQRAAFLATVYGVLTLLTFVSTFLIPVLNVRWHRRQRRSCVSPGANDTNKGCVRWPREPCDSRLACPYGIKGSLATAKLEPRCEVMWNFR